MALDKAAFKAGLKADLVTIFATPDNDPAVQAEAIANAIGDRLDTYVKQATVSVTTTISLATSELQTTVAIGSPTGPPLVPVDLSGTGTLS